MKLPQADWSRWLVASVLALVVTVLVLSLFRMPGGDEGSARPENRGVEPVTLAPGTDSLLNEEALLRDPTPLFLPTKWNAADNALRPDTRRETSGAFESYPPALKFAGAALALDLPAAVAVPRRPAEAFGTDRSQRLLSGFGQSDWEVAPLAPRAAYVKVTGADGQVVFSRPIEDAAPPSEAVWQPLEFLIAVDTTGMVRPPVLIESSRVAGVDGYFEDFLAKGLQIGERLSPGFYRVSIGP
jgi:hypothetical protein